MDPEAIAEFQEPGRKAGGVVGERGSLAGPLAVALVFVEQEVALAEPFHQAAVGILNGTVRVGLGTHLLLHMAGSEVDARPALSELAGGGAEEGARLGGGGAVEPLEGGGHECVLGFDGGQVSGAVGGE